MLPDKVLALRKSHPRLHYRNYLIRRVGEELRIAYDFYLESDILFSPEIIIPSKREQVDSLTERLAFLVGMVELISIWKLACPPEIIVECGSLSDWEISWWEELYRRGLGEFFYLNKISPAIQFNIRSVSDDALQDYKLSSFKTPPESALILVGGGKDSIVSLELASELASHSDLPLSSLCINPIPASIDAIDAAGFAPPLVIKRQLDPTLLQMNSQGYLNGHTPYSALLAFSAALAAYQNGYANVVASNETSASEGNAFVEGVEVNHQYSKSFHFEGAFRDYMKLIEAPVNYFSFMRPINELQICALFSQMPKYHQIFRSCNREQTLAARSAQTDPTKRSGWCGECPKCVFTFLCLKCFLDEEQLRDIFGCLPSEYPGFAQTCAELSGDGEHKPFECVGTYAEVQCALNATPEALNEFLGRWDAAHFVPHTWMQLMRSKLDALRSKH